MLLADWLRAERARAADQIIRINTLYVLREKKAIADTTQQKQRGDRVNV
jgi:hypothetical protein